MVRYRKSASDSSLLIPVWKNDHFPALRGFVHGLTHQVRLRGRSGQCEGGYLEKLVREAQLFETSSVACLSQKLTPLSRELENLRKTAEAPEAAAVPAAHITSTAAARAAHKQAEAEVKAAKARAEAAAKAAALQGEMLSQIQMTKSLIDETYKKVNVYLAEYCRAVAFTPIQPEIPVLQPNIFNKAELCRSYHIENEKEDT